MSILEKPKHIVIIYNNAKSKKEDEELYPKLRKIAEYTREFKKS